MTKRILLTGGAGYIGSHTYVALVEAGYNVVIIDDFSNAQRDVPARLETITGAPVTLVEMDVRDQGKLNKVLQDHDISAVIHFAAKKAVGESVRDPLGYIDCNVGGLTSLMQAMQTAGVFNLVFSSSATVYGDATQLPIPETATRQHTNPYGMTKVVCEEMIEAASAADPRWSAGILRYFNPVGAHETGLIGEDPKDIPNNLMPFIAKVAKGELPEVQVFGDIYDTPDGTGVRDYIHVSDLAAGHVLSLDALFRDNEGHMVNLGTGQGVSVLEMIQAYSKACEQDLAHRIVPPRAGDVASCYADPTKAQALLGFTAVRDLETMCKSSWKWVSGSAQNT